MVKQKRIAAELILRSHRSLEPDQTRDDSRQSQQPVSTCAGMDQTSDHRGITELIFPGREDIHAVSRH